MLSLHRIAPVTALAIIMPVSFYTAILTNAADKTQPETALSSSRQIVLDADSAQLLALSGSTSTIRPGESKVQAEQRIKAEKEAAEREAAAKAAVEQAAREQESRQNRRVASREIGRLDSLVDLEALYSQAEQTYGVDRRIIKSVHTVETGRAVYTTAVSPMNAQGPFQFLPGTMRTVGVDGDGDGRVDIMSIYDALPSAARYLRICGGDPFDVRKALWGYNPSIRYYNRVMEVARSLGYEG